ncbi:hypothetical protein [Phenylobacterium sp.]|uniref:hypothetical protein n=1 Tax=Phenylobacterium sp. TaxID=1871053 RepID=UPI0025FB425F|nr:hypothetical protein [Phenylobacterium sp.]MBX3482511.1 hypothetical protein [Phenylobacterium sp.]MCW5758258.1 hypothetical protein [Phenylobacterium sp.]
MVAVAEAPEEIGRNEFDEWCWKRGLELRDVVDGLAHVAATLSCESDRRLRVPSIETVRLIRLPFSDSRRRVPGVEVMELIHRFTEGAIVAAHFYPRDMRGLPEPVSAEGQV